MLLFYGIRISHQMLRCYLYSFSFCLNRSNAPALLGMSLLLIASEAKQEFRGSCRCERSEATIPKIVLTLCVRTAEALCAQAKPAFKELHASGGGHLQLGYTETDSTPHNGRIVFKLSHTITFTSSYSVLGTNGTEASPL